MSEYKSINCGLHDLIEDRIVRRAQCTLVYLAENSADPIQYTGRLLDVFSRDGAEFIAIENDAIVRLDRIVTLDATAFQST